MIMKARGEKLPHQPVFSCRAADATLQMNLARLLSFLNSFKGVALVIVNRSSRMHAFFTTTLAC